MCVYVGSKKYKDDPISVCLLCLLFFMIDFITGIIFVMLLNAHAYEMGS